MEKGIGKGWINETQIQILMSFAKRKSFTNLYVIQDVLWFSKV